MTHVQALADCFGVPAAYFFDDETARRVDEQLKLMVALRDADVARIALRARGLSPDSLKAILTIVEATRKAERLDGGPTGGTSVGLGDAD